MGWLLTIGVYLLSMIFCILFLKGATGKACPSPERIEDRNAVLLQETMDTDLSLFGIEYQCRMERSRIIDGG
jgi:hypothetical protein